MPVKVVTAASGDYSNTLNAQMGKDGAPTVYNIGNMSGLKDWDEYALDLTGTPLAGELATNDFNLYNEAGELKAMGYCYESFGIIVNTKLLADAGHSLPSWASTPSPPPVWTAPLPGASPVTWPTCLSTMSSVTTT